jgi:hypothetical protein
MKQNLNNINKKIQFLKKKEENIYLAKAGRFLSG